MSRCLRRPAALLLVLSTILFAVACSDDPDEPEPTPSTEATAAETATPAATGTVLVPDPPPLQWQNCGSFECATLMVPLDYSNPNGKKIGIAMTRLLARDKDERIGSLLVNFGGPGASGVEFLAPWQAGVPGEIKDHFDLVSFDPRGVGQSAPISCTEDIEKYLTIDPTAESPEEWEQIKEVTRDFAEDCEERNKELLPFIGTNNVARDLELMRRALGDEKLTYLGYSYGTSIGAVYAQMFPDRIRAFVLDGVVDTTISGDEMSLGQALGFEGALQDFIANCASRKCITAYPDDPMEGIRELIRRAEAAPIPASSADRPAGPAEVYTAVLGSLYTDTYWSLLTRAVNSALAGNASLLVQRADSYWERNSDGSYPNLIDVLNAVTCVDSAFNRDPDHYLDLADDFAKNAPTFGPLLAEGGLSCSVWQVPPTPTPDVQAQGAPPILLVGTTRDPATPYEWAVSVHEKLANSVLLTYRGLGHTAYTRNGCINDAVNAYLIDLELPAEGTTCGDAAYSTPIDITPNVP